MDKVGILRRSAALVVALLATASVAPGAAQQPQDADDEDAAPEGPVSCLNRPEIQRTKILSNRNIVFVTRFEKIYNNQLPKECPGLEPNGLVNYPITSGRLCAGDRFQVLWEQQPGSYLPAAVCPLGAFLPITESELEDLVAMTEENRAHPRRGRSTREAVTTEQVEMPRVAPATPGAAVSTTPAE
jgi:hypothetical protein